MFSKRIKTAKEGGVWALLIDFVLPMWLERGWTRIVEGPKQDGQTRTLKICLATRYGGVTPIYLNSLDVDADVENSLKERAFSLIYFSELSKFKTRKIFDTSILSLRMPGLAYKDHLWLADTNPSDEGKRSWIYDVFWNERLRADPPDYCKTKRDIERFVKRQSDMNVTNIYLDDNPFLSDEERDEVISAHAHDPALYARYVKGEWVTATSDAFFNGIFDEDLHVIGSCDSSDETEWEGILPDTARAELFTSWDVGDRNSAILFISRERDKSGKYYYSVIDEIVVIDEQFLMEDLVTTAIRKMNKWETHMGHPVRWEHFSDTSSWNYKIAAQASEQIMIQKISGGRIRLHAADKYAGATLDAVDMVKRLLYEGRIFFAAHCKYTIEMMKGLAPQKTPSGILKIPHSALSHPWDSLRYGVQSLEPIALARASSPRSGSVRQRIVSMA